MSSNLNHLRKCFRPRQWFAHSEPDTYIAGIEESIMWVYRKDTNGKYEVGYFMPDGTWFADSTYDTVEAASARVNYLNGGN